ncbi:sporulation histidine kinase inhibitor Sda [Bacillaceae bacterium W0354]
MDFLSNKQIIDAYQKAVELQLEEDFILLLKREIMRRNIESDHTFTDSLEETVKKN